MTCSTMEWFEAEALVVWLLAGKRSVDVARALGIDPAGVRMVKSRLKRGQWVTGVERIAEMGLLDLSKLG